MKYKVGDKVRIKSIDWYNKNKDEYGNIDVSHDFTFYADRSKYCGKVFTIDEVFDNCYTVKEDNHEYYWADEMIEGLVEESDDFEKMYIESEKRYEEYSKGEYCHKQSFKWGFQEGCDYAHENEKLEINLKNGYQFKDENGNVINAMKIVLEKKKKEYPKTYEECCRVLGVSEFEYNHTGTKVWYRHKLMATLDKLMLCRDAYWKIAGEEMGLGKPWEPDWSDDNAKYSIYTIKGALTKAISCYDGAILTFPTAEMRDAFYEAFKEEIETVKELL